jgi:DNA-binding HxlR family transcriptional regulator
VPGQPEPRYCAQFHRAIELIGRRWTGVIVQALMGGAERFGEIRCAVPGLSDRLLSERLRELEAEQIVARICPPERGAAPRYVLTCRGRGLYAVFAAISAWAATLERPEVGSD